MEIPGARITEHDEPALFAVLATVARELDAALPNEVYLVADVNLLVTELGQLFGPDRRILIVGMGVLPLLNRLQLRSALAHEYAHYLAGDYRTGPIGALFRSALQRSVESKAGVFVEGALGPFARRWHERSRDAELRADTRAVEVYGAELHASTVVRVATGALLFELYMAREVAPIVGRGFRPERLVEGFMRFLQNEHELDYATNGLSLLRALSTRPLDTHPALEERVKHLVALGHSGGHVDDPEGSSSSVALLGDFARQDRAVTDAWAARYGLLVNTPVAWDDVGEKALLPGILENFAQGAKAVRGFVPDAGDDDAVLEALVARLEREGRRALAPLLDELRPAFTGIEDPLVGIAGLLLAGTLLRRGARLRYEPGIPFRVEREGATIDPFRVAADGAREGDAALCLALRQSLAPSSTRPPPGSSEVP